ncbi:MAG TPA: pyrroline-5-carboxylate reductase [Solirubrobacteraceae bacterium]|nr:pyrroline-5-carboxylate reductase [Solirubrobacteraceae bacterium]
MTLGLIGSGNMARALARGWGEPVLCTDGGSGRARALVAEVGGEALSSNSELARRADMVVLCHKPAQLEAVAAEVDGEAQAIVSVLGATSLQRLHAAYPGAQVARAMPNTAVEVREGVVCLCQDGGGDEFQVQVRELFGRVGRVVEVPERLIDVATAIAGVAPAYTALIAEAQIDAAVRHGMPSSLAADLTVSSLAGSATLLAERGADTLGVRREVASPGGLTARGLDALERGGVRSAFMDAMEAVLEGSRR